MYRFLQLSNLIKTSFMYFHDDTHNPEAILNSPLCDISTSRYPGELLITQLLLFTQFLRLKDVIFSNFSSTLILELPVLLPFGYSLKLYCCKHKAREREKKKFKNPFHKRNRHLKDFFSPFLLFL